MARLFLTVTLGVVTLFSFAQCPPGPLGTGNFLDKPTGCATGPGLDINFTPIYSQLEDNSTIFIDWGDGTANEMIFPGTSGGQTGVSYNTPVMHTYTEAATAGGCLYTITAWVEGPNNCYTVAETTVMTDIVVWNTDNFGDGGAGLVPDPILFTVCAGSSSTVQLTDLSPWNCTDIAVTASVNEAQRWTQWEYGVFENITGVVTIDGNPQAFPFPGAVDDHLAPVLDPQAPGNTSLDIFIPATAQIGEEFHVRLHNWNQCNEYDDGMGVPPVNPSVFQDAIIRVIAPPVPSYTALDMPGGAALPEFCINEDIYFRNDTPTPGAYTYEWRFYDGPADTDPLLGTLTDVNPTFQFANGGVKLVRMIATDNGADGNCDVIYDDVVTLAPDAVADFEFYDAGFGMIINPDFCQTGSDVFTVGFRDNTIDVANTTYRYEFYDEADVLIDTEPTSGVFLPDPVPDFTRNFSAEAWVRVRLVAFNTATSCSSFEQDTVFVYGRPIPTFTTNEVCEGERTTFSNITDQLTGFTTVVNDDIIDTYEWDFSYDNLVFNSELTRTDDLDFDWYLDGDDNTPGVEPPTSVPQTHVVAVRMTSQKGGCVSTIFQANVVVHPNPDSQLAYDYVTDVCPGDIITFTNNSINPTLTMQYFLETTHAPSGFFSSTTLVAMDTPLSFDNPDDTTRTFSSVIRAQTSDGCETLSNVLTFRVSPDEVSSFTDLNYQLFNSNCSPWSSTLSVDQPTRDLLPDSYSWTISDGGVLLPGYPVVKVSTDPDFHILDYNLDNTTAAIVIYEAVLEVTKAGVCIASDTFNLQISPQPEAAFTFNRVEDCEEVVFELEATQKGLADYNWTYNPAPDNEFGAGDTRLISYNRDVATGSDFNADITLVTTNLANCPSDPEMITENIERQRPDVTPSFTLSATTVQLPDATVNITNTSIDDPGFTYLWDFGDGTTSALRDPGSHTYTDFGSFVISLTITDAFCESETFQGIQVTPADPLIDFEADVLEGCVPLTVRFTNLSQSAVSGDFLWEFGDGSISREDEVEHTYFDGGSYTVRLRGTNTVGTTIEEEKTEYINALTRPLADFLTSSNIVYIPDQEVVFRNLSENATEFFWDFGDGDTSTLFEPRHAYEEEGTYDITLIASNELGCTDTLFRAAEVEAVIGGETNSPNAFTPNLSGPNGGVDDGSLNLNSVNDVFLPRLEGVIRFRMLIYNKWGQLLFQTEDQNVGWDGYYKGRLAPAGVYIYKLELRYSDGRDEIKAGDVTLIR